MKFQYKVKLQSPDGSQVHVLNPIAIFKKNSNDYGNRLYMKLEGAGLGFCNIFDCRYDLSVNENDLSSYALKVMNELWTGKNDAWKLLEIHEVNI